MKRKINLILLLLSAFISFIIVNNSKDNFNNYKKIVRLSGALQSLNLWTDQRAYPYNDIPQDAYYKAFEYTSKKFYTDNYFPGYWEAIGPKNVGGRTNAVAFNPQNPNTIFAGAASGGFWRSYTAGVGPSAWEYINTGYPVLGVNAIAIPPNDSNVIYLGTGEVYGYQNSIGGLNIRTTRGSYGIGILKTTNFGTTWIKTLDWSYNQRRGVQVIKVDPLNSNILYAGTTEGIYKTTNAGSSWFQVHSVIMTTDLVIHPGNPNLIFAVCGNLSSTGYGAYRSTDAGSSWTKITSGWLATYSGKAHLEVFKTNPNIIFASIGKGSSSGAGTVLCKSYDFGLNWLTVNSTSDYATYQGWYSHFVIPHQTDSSKILCGGIDIWKSTNGGTNLTTKSSWSAWYLNTTPPPGGPEGPANYSHADHHAYAVHPTNPNYVILGGDGGIFKTTDFGETFAGCNGGYQTTQFYKRLGVGQKDSLVAIGGLQDNASVVFSGGIAWRRVGGGDGCCSAVNPFNSNTMFTSSQYMSPSRSLNRGISWSGVSIPSSNEAFNAPYIICPSDSTKLYGGGDKIYKSTNGGTSFSVMNNNQVFTGDPILVIDVSYTNPDTVYLATAPNLQRARLYRSTNGGTSFTEITGTLPDRYIIDIAVDPTNSRIVYCAVSGFGSAHLFKSVDAGTTWTAVGNSLPDVPTSAVIVDPLIPQNVYVGNDLGVFASTDGGITFTSFNEGFFGVSTLIMDLRISNKDRKLYAATHGNGVFTRKLLDKPVGIKNENETVIGFQLYQNYPNPFNPSTRIQYTVSRRQFVTLKVYDILGNEITTLVNEEKEPGYYNVHFDGSNQPSGVQYASGVYLYSLIAGDYKKTNKMLLIK
jgi:photosystem II stability/assembly factor-like uncharacterized protein